MSMVYNIRLRNQPLQDTRYFIVLLCIQLYTNKTIHAKNIQSIPNNGPEHKKQVHISIPISVNNKPTLCSEE